MTEKELILLLTKTIKDKTLHREVHVVPYLLPIIKQYADEEVVDIVARALRKKNEKN